MYAHHLGRAEEILDLYGGTDFSYATQQRVSIEKGATYLVAVQLYAKGILRVYAACCRTPVANVPSPQIAFVGIPHLFMRHEGGSEERDRVLGPIVHRLQGRYARGEMPAGAHPGTPTHLLIRGLSSVVWDTLRGCQRPSPFHASGSNRPIAEPILLSAAQRERLRQELAIHGVRLT